MSKTTLQIITLTISTFAILCSVISIGLSYRRWKENQ